MIDMPIKCPVAPLEFCFLADWYLHERGIRDRVADHLRHARSTARSPRPTCNRELSGLLADKGIEVVDRVQHRPGGRRRRPADQLGRARGRRSTCSSRSRCTAARRSSPLPGALATSSASCPTDPHTLQSRRRCERLRDRRRRQRPDVQGRVGGALRGRDARREHPPLPRRPRARGQLRRPRQLLHRDRLPQGAADRLQLRNRTASGPVPRAALGPLPLLRESRLNHLGKLAVPVDLLAHAATRPRRCRGSARRCQLAGKQLDASAMERSTR